MDSVTEGSKEAVAEKGNDLEGPLEFICPGRGEVKIDGFFFSASIQRLTNCQPSLVESYECIFVEAAGEKKMANHGFT